MNFSQFVSRVISMVVFVMVWLHRVYRYGYTFSAFVAYALYLVLIKYVRIPIQNDNRVFVISEATNGGSKSTRVLAAVTVGVKWFDWNFGTLGWFISKTAGLDSTYPLTFTYTDENSHQIKYISCDLNTTTDTVTKKPFLYGDFDLGDDDHAHLVQCGGCSVVVVGDDYNCNPYMYEGGDDCSCTGVDADAPRDH